MAKKGEAEQPVDTETVKRAGKTLRAEGVRAAQAARLRELEAQPHILMQDAQEIKRLRAALRTQE